MVRNSAPLLAGDIQGIPPIKVYAHGQPSSEPLSLFSVPQTPDHFLVATPSRSLLRVAASDQAVVSQWSVPRDFSLVLHSPPSLYFGLQQQQVLWRWSAANEFIESQGQKLVLTRPVFKLLKLPSFKDTLCVVYTDGSADLHSFDLAAPLLSFTPSSSSASSASASTSAPSKRNARSSRQKKEIEEENPQCVYAWAGTIEGIARVSIVLKSPTNVLTLHEFEVASLADVPSSSSLNLTTLLVDISNKSELLQICADEKSHTLALLWSDLHLVVIDLDSSKITINFILSLYQQPDASQPRRRASAASKSSKPATPSPKPAIALHFVSVNTLGVIGYRAVDAKLVLSLWNTRLGTCSSTFSLLSEHTSIDHDDDHDETLKDDAAAPAVASATPFSSSYQQQHLLISYSDMVLLYVLPQRATSSSLLASIGSLNQTRQMVSASQPSSDPPVLSPFSLKDALLRSDRRSPSEVSSSRAPAVVPAVKTVGPQLSLEGLEALLAIDSAAEFTSRFYGIVHTFSPTPEQTPEQAFQALNPKQGMIFPPSWRAVQLPQPLVDGTIRHCCAHIPADNGFWRPVDFLIHLLPISLRSYPMLLEHLLAPERFRFFLMNLHKFQDISEVQIAVIINNVLLLLHDSSIIRIAHRFHVQARLADKYQLRPEKTALKARFRLLAFLYDLPFSRAFMIQALRQELAFTQVHQLMVAIRNLLHDLFHTEPIPRKHFKLPQVTSLIRWASIVLDSFSTHFITYDELAADIKSFRRVMAQYQKQCQAFGALQGILDVFQTTRPTDLPQEKKNYRIELWDL